MSITKMQINHSSEKFKDTQIFCICLICFFLFLYTGYSKLIDHERFLSGLKRVSLIGPFAVDISWIVQIAEIMISALLVIPKTSWYGLYAFTFLMSPFTVYIISVILWAKHLPCHCGGAIEHLSWTQHVAFNLVFIILSGYALWLVKKVKQS
jgi:uncharacterized membrane protein (DUF485 family)